MDLIGKRSALLECLQVITQAVLGRTPDQIGKARVKLVQLLRKRFAISNTAPGNPQGFERRQRVLPVRFERADRDGQRPGDVAYGGFDR